MKRKQLKPKYAVGQKVRLNKPDLFGEVFGTITEIEKVYQAVNEDGTFDLRGLATLESTISSIQLPHEIKGDTLIVHYPERILKFTGGETKMNAKTEISVFRHYAYTVDTAKMRGMYGEKQFTIIS